MNSWNTPEYEESKSYALIILAVIVALVILPAGYFVYNFVIKPEREKEKIEYNEQFVKGSKVIFHKTDTVIITWIGHRRVENIEITYKDKHGTWQRLMVSNWELETIK